MGGVTFVPTGMAVDGLGTARLGTPLEGLKVDLVLIPETVGILLGDLLPLLGTGREVLGLVGVVLEREGVLDETRPDLAFTGRNPLVDLLSRSETGAEEMEGKEMQGHTKSSWSMLNKFENGKQFFPKLRRHELCSQYEILGLDVGY